MPSGIENLKSASASAAQRHGIAVPSDARLEDALASALDPQKLIDNMAEAWRISGDQAKTLLEEHGFAGVLARIRPGAAVADDDKAGPAYASVNAFSFADGQIRICAISPAFDEPARASHEILTSVETAFRAFASQAAADPLAVLYRQGPLAYAESWLHDQAPKIGGFIDRQFGSRGPAYIVNSGIGANEQFNYFVSALANAMPGMHPTWLLANSPKEIADLPQAAGLHNTLFMEFSRSGITEETVKLHECTPRAARRIVFANTGPLKQLAERDGNLLLSLPDEVSGRYGRNKTPILMAPMFVMGLDVASYWKTIQAACDTLDVSSPESAACVIARWLRVQQLRRSVNHVYLGTNDGLLRYSADEFCQFWNEGVNRDGNDITMSRYLGLPRDSHMNLEAILGTSERKIAIFLLNTGRKGGTHPLATETDPINPAHAGLSVAEIDQVLALANVKRCSEKMPTLLITVDGPDLRASAWLGQLWADVTLVYSRLIGVDPGSNPEVKNVRVRAAQWLAEKSRAFELLP